MQQADDREFVKKFYGKAAESPKENLCCPTSYPTGDISHIPQEVIDRFYGCGSPMSVAEVRGGETVVDLGSGAGIDCFIAAKLVGSEGSVIGVDMTDEMLRVANNSNQKVSSNLGYEVVEFRKGYLEEIPAESKSVDLITSNCVINLSPDKKRVFSEMWRVLKDLGRIVISDIVAERGVPEYLRTDKELWGECISGALTENQFLSFLEQVGFYGLEILNKTNWKEVDGYKFHSVTLRAYKYEKSAGCVYIGHTATYKGPNKVVIDDEGHVFQRNQPVEVCTDTAEKLSNPPYIGVFTITEPTGKEREVLSCSPNLNGNNCC